MSRRVAVHLLDVRYLPVAFLGVLLLTQVWVLPVYAGELAGMV